jgi:hypothetical protein
MFTLFGSIPGAISKVEKRGHIAVHDEDHVTALATIPPIRPPFGNKFFPAKGNATISTIARLDDYGRFINKHRKDPASIISLITV